MVYALAESLGLCRAEPPRPILPLAPAIRDEIVATVRTLNLA